MDKQKVALSILAFVATMNIISFALMGHDKKCARQGKWRISEKRLFLTTALFGGLGGVLGMKVFHHKTKHWYFRIFFPVMMIAQLAILLAGMYWIFK